MERLHKIELQSRGGVTNERVHANPSVIRVTRTIIQEGVLERVVINFRDTWSMENMRHNHGYHESITWEVRGEYWRGEEEEENISMRAH